MSGDPHRLFDFVGVSSKFLTELVILAVRIRKRSSGKTLVIPEAAMYGYCFPNGAYKLTCTIPLTSVPTKTWVPDLGCISFPSGTRTTCSSSSRSTASMLLSATSVLLVVVPLSFYSLSTINIATSYGLYGTIFQLARKHFFTNL